MNTRTLANVIGLRVNLGFFSKKTRRPALQLCCVFASMVRPIRLRLSLAGGNAALVELQSLPFCNSVSSVGSPFRQCSCA